jgi:hypothetical protein
MLKTCLSLLLGLTSLPLHAGTIHQVFNETYSPSSALATIDLVTPPLVDESYLVTVDEEMTGDWVSPDLDEVGPYISWTDDLGPEQLGNGQSLAPCPQNAHSPSQPKILKMLQHSDQPAVGPSVAVFPVRVKANTHLTLTIPHSSPDHFTYTLAFKSKAGEIRLPPSRSG